MSNVIVVNVLRKMEVKKVTGLFKYFFSINTANYFDVEKAFDQLVKATKTDDATIEFVVNENLVATLFVSENKYTLKMGEIETVYERFTKRESKAILENIMSAI